MKKLIPNHHLKVDNIHTLAIYQIGNPNAKPVIVCHGGPGGSIGAYLLSVFDLHQFNVIAFDQRGCGQSKPFLSIENNTLNDLVEDIEKIRQYFKLNKINLYGGSFGTTLALSYAIKYPNNVDTIILRGVFLGRKTDINWLYQEGASNFFYDSFQIYKNFIPKKHQHDLLGAYYKIFTSNINNKQKDRAFQIWSNWEKSAVKLYPPSLDYSSQTSDAQRCIALLEAHYFYHQLWWDDDNYILNNIDKIKNHKIVIIHGLYDIDCLPINAYLLAEKLNNYDLYLPIAGHGANDLDYNRALITAVNHILNEGSFYHINLSNNQYQKISNKYLSKVEYKLNDVLIFHNKSTLEIKRFLIKNIEEKYNNYTYSLSIIKY